MLQPSALSKDDSQDIFLPRRMRKTALTAVVVLAVCVGGCAFRKPSPIIPTLRSGSAEEVGPRLSNYSEATVPRNGLIVVRSDDFVGAPAPLLKKKQKPIGSINLADALSKASGLEVVDQSQPFETLENAAQRLKGAPVGNLVVISYGFGDAAAKSKADFRAALIAMIKDAHDRGAAVYLVVEPATALPLSAPVEAYRNIFRSVAAAEGAGLIDAPAILQKAGRGPSQTAIQTKAAVDIIAGNIATYIKVAPESGQ